MKGIILAGGKGTRLRPATEVINKHLLPVYDKPMIYYPISTLMLAGIREILLITTPSALPLFEALLGDGQQWAIDISYAVQEGAGGLADAFLVGESFIGDSDICLLLGDNLFYGTGLSHELLVARTNLQGAHVFAYHVENPSAYGIAEFDKNDNVLSLEEKPLKPRSSYAVTGLYFYDNSVVNIAKNITPSARGELEITDVNKVYLAKKQLRVTKLNRGHVWLDMGTQDLLLAAANYIQLVELRQGLKIGSPEEIAWRGQYIDAEAFESLITKISNPVYAKYLKGLLKYEEVAIV